MLRKHFLIYLLLNALLLLEGFQIVEMIEVSSTKVVGCYYQSYAVRRSGFGKFSTTDLDPSLCTHVYYAFAGIRADTGEVTILNYDVAIEKNGFLNFTNLRVQYPETKFLVSIQGTALNFSTVAANEILRNNFADSAVNFLQEFNFDGLDIDWEYPTRGGGTEADRENFVKMLEDLQIRFQEYNYVLTAAVVGYGPATSYYDVPGMNRVLDQFNVMTYNYYSYSGGRTGHNSPLFNPSSILSCNASIHAWINSGASPSKLVLGIPFYGKSFTLEDPHNNGVGAPVTGAGLPGPYINSRGNLANLEILGFLNEINGNWTVVWDDTAKVPYAFSGDQWVGYENEDSVLWKVKYATEMNLAGVMTWSVDLDDFRGLFGEENPLLREMDTIHNDV